MNTPRIIYETADRYLARVPSGPGSLRYEIREKRCGESGIADTLVFWTGDFSVALAHWNRIKDISVVRRKTKWIEW